jgi:hypothetical protein
MAPTTEPTAAPDKASGATAAAATSSGSRDPRDPAVSLFRLASAALGAAAVITTLVQSLNRNGSAVNFFSYFTILSNILGIAVFCVGGIAPLRGRRQVNDYLRGAGCLYLAITGVVYWTLLRNVSTPEGHTWTNGVVHGVMPAVAVIDWLIAPPRQTLRYPRVLYWLIFPVAYIAYSLIRGPIAQWYPYPFLDPRKNGYVHVTIMTLLVTVAFVAFTALIAAVGNRLGARDSSDERGSS